MDRVDRNTDIGRFFEIDFDSDAAVRRFKEFRKNLEADKDHVRVHGQYYNNIHLGKRIFGPARKQMFSSTIVGGMERRFEIIDNQVNHIPFTHEAFDRNLDKVRNMRIACRDDTRVVLESSGDQNDFIHANWVRGGPLFNQYILTQAPMYNTVVDFWRMVTQEDVGLIIMPISRKEPDKSVGQSLTVGNIVVSTDKVEQKGKILQVYHMNVHKFDPITKQTSAHMKVQLYQGDLNNSDNLHAPLLLIHASRCVNRPAVVVDHLGISRGACLVAVEICLMSMLRGPSYKHPVQRAVHFLRSCRSFAVETPMQYIYIHRVILHFLKPYTGEAKAFEEDYERWLDSRSRRLFLEEPNGAVPAYLLLSPRVDPDLLAQAQKKARPNSRREMHSNIGELPQPNERADFNNALQLPSKYPRGKRYLY